MGLTACPTSIGAVPLVYGTAEIEALALSLHGLFERLEVKALEAVEGAVYNTNWVGLPYFRFK